MSWEEALKAMLDGKKVRNQYFTKEEWFEMKGGRIYAEDGCPMDNWFIGEGWQKTGWSII